VKLPPPGRDGWSSLRLPKVARQTVYHPVTIDGVEAVESESECSASALVLELHDFDLQATPILQWRWKIEEGLKIENERVKAGDDFAARVYVMFRFDAAHASWLERLEHTIGEKLYGEKIPGDALDYVWSSYQPAGSTWDNPFTAAAKMISLGSGRLPQWKQETADVARDYRKLFGREPPPIMGVGIMTDSDNSCQKAAATFADFQWKGQERVLSTGD